MSTCPCITFSHILSIKTSFPPRNYLPPLNFEQRGVARRVNVSVAGLSQSLIDNDTLGKVNKTQRVETKLRTHHGLSHDFFSSKLQETQWGFRMTSSDPQVLGWYHVQWQGQDSQQQKYMAFKVGSLKICGFISALSCLCSRNQSYHFEDSLKPHHNHHKESRIVTKQGSCNSQSSLTRILSISSMKESSSPSTSWTPSLAQYSHVRLKPGNCKIISAYCFRFKWRDTLLCNR